MSEENDNLLKLLASKQNDPRAARAVKAIEDGNNLSNINYNNVKNLRPNQSSEEEIVFEFHNAEDVEPKSQPWLWPGLIPFNSVTLFAGEGGIGKSHLLLDIASHVSTGKAFKACGFDHKLDCGTVLFITAEDDFEYTIKPKLLASNANLEKIKLLKMTKNLATGKRKFVDLSLQLDKLKIEIKKLADIKLVIIDPILYFIGNIRENYNSEVSNFLGELSDFAKELNIAIVVNKHFRKKSSGSSITSAMDEVGGAGSWINSPRISWAITRWHEDLNVRIISNLKANILKSKSDCYAYKIETCVIHLKDGSPLETCRLIWLDSMINITANEAVNAETYEKSKNQIAQDFIINYLTENGQAVSVHVKDKALLTGIKLMTFERAIKELKDKKIVKVDSGIRGSKLWSLIESDNF